MRTWLRLACAGLLFTSCTSAQTSTNAQLAALGSSAPIKQTFQLHGKVVAVGREVIPNATVTLASATSNTDANGEFAISAAPGRQQISITADGYAPLQLSISVLDKTELQFEMQSSQVETVTASTDTSGLGSTARVYDATDLIQSAPGQPGVPSESTSGGVKAPQYFAPGVAGDHGEPIAQYIQVGGFQLPNNLPANAHGNGYADPNLLISNVVARRQRIQQVIVCMAAPPRGMLRHVWVICDLLSIRVRMLPPVEEILTGKNSVLNSRNTTPMKSIGSSG